LRGEKGGKRKQVYENMKQFFFPENKKENRKREAKQKQRQVD
jgi:hypothetical protein